MICTTYCNHLGLACQLIIRLIYSTVYTFKAVQSHYFLCVRCSLFIFRIAFAEYETKDDADAEIEKMHEYELDGHTLSVQISNSQKNQSSGASGIPMPTKNLIIRGLSFSTTSEGLKDAFGAAVIDARVIMDRDTGRSKGYVRTWPAYLCNLYILRYMCLTL